MLAAMFNVDSNFSKPGIMKDGAYCLDRDPEVFKVILWHILLHLYNNINQDIQND